MLTPTQLSMAAAHTPPEFEKQGLTLAQFARFFGVNPGTIRGHLVEVPSGPAPVLPAGEIPCRKVGNVKRIFPQDLFGTLEERVERNGNIEKETASTEHEDYWRRQINNIRLNKHFEG